MQGYGSFEPWGSLLMLPTALLVTLGLGGLRIELVRRRVTAEVHSIVASGELVRVCRLASHHAFGVPLVVYSAVRCARGVRPRRRHFDVKVAPDLGKAIVA